MLSGDWSGGSHLITKGSISLKNCSIIWMIVGPLFNLISFIDKGRERGLNVTGEGSINFSLVFSTQLFPHDEWVLLTVGK